MESEQAPIDELLAIMRRLRDPDGGCPWDIEQSFATIAPFTIEEAYEVADAIERDDMEDLQDELGDLLLQVVFHACIAAESQLFDFDDVARSIVNKMLRRHPHVFGDATFVDMPQFKASWEAGKARERAEKLKRRSGEARLASAAQRPVIALDFESEESLNSAQSLDSWQSLEGDQAFVSGQSLEGAQSLDSGQRLEGDQTVVNDQSTSSALEGVAVNLPALIRAEKLQKRAARVGFDWPADALVWDKLAEEIAEVQEAQAQGDQDALEDEMGDVLFTVVNLARRRGVNAETALRRANAKFERRFRHVEQSANAQSLVLDELDIAELDRLWNEAKQALAKANSPV